MASREQIENLVGGQLVPLASAITISTLHCQEINENANAYS